MLIEKRIWWKKLLALQSTICPSHWLLDAFHTRINSKMCPFDRKFPRSVEHRRSSIIMLQNLFWYFRRSRVYENSDYNSQDLLYFSFLWAAIVLTIKTGIYSWWVTHDGTTKAGKGPKLVTIQHLGVLIQDHYRELVAASKDIGTSVKTFPSSASRFLVHNPTNQKAWKPYSGWDILIRSDTALSYCPISHGSTKP